VEAVRSLNSIHEQQVAAKPPLGQACEVFSMCADASSKGMLTATAAGADHDAHLHAGSAASRPGDQSADACVGVTSAGTSSSSQGAELPVDVEDMVSHWCQVKVVASSATAVRPSLVGLAQE
jgi:hypothetical protein